MADHLDLTAEVRDLFERKLREFIAFCGQEWTLTECDMDDFYVGKGADFQKGYNTAMTDGLSGAISHWLGENDL